MSNLSLKECKEILGQGEYGYLGVSDESKPYIIPVSYAYFDDKIYIHSTISGRKINSIKNNPNICFNVAEYFRDEKGRIDWKSVLIEGTASLIENKPAVMGLMVKFGEHYAGVSSFHDAMKNKKQAKGHPGMVNTDSSKADFADNGDKAEFNILMIEVIPKEISGRKRISFTDN